MLGLSRILVLTIIESIYLKYSNYCEGKGMMERIKRVM